MDYIRVTGMRQCSSSPLLHGKVSKKEYFFFSISHRVAGATLSIDIPIALEALSLKFVSTSSRSQ